MAAVRSAGSPPEGREWQHFLTHSQIKLTKPDQTKEVYCINCSRWCDRERGTGLPVCYAKGTHAFNMEKNWYRTPTENKVAWAVDAIKKTNKIREWAPQAMHEFGLICSQNQEGDDLFKKLIPDTSVWEPTGAESPGPPGAWYQPAYVEPAAAASGTGSAEAELPEAYWNLWHRIESLQRQVLDLRNALDELRTENFVLRGRMDQQVLEQLRQ